MQARDRRVPRNKTMDLEREILLPVEDGSHWLDFQHVVQRRVIRYLRTQANRLRQSNFIRLQNSLICDQKIDREALAPVFDRSLEVVFSVQIHVNFCRAKTTDLNSVSEFYWQQSLNVRMRRSRGMVLLKRK